MNTAPIVSKVWSFCHTLRDDGVGYGDYLEQLTYLIFLKMADEYAKPPYNRDVGIPAEHKWTSLRTRKGAELEDHYVATLRALGARTGLLGQIFTSAQNKIQDPAKLYRLIAMVDDADWVTMGADIKGDIYESLLERNAEDTKSGAGQYFTPHALIRAMVECVRPYNRQDFWATTSNKQLNFVQHIRTMLKTTGRAAVVVPDNVLFEGGAGETIRKKLLENTDLHTILRLPTGVFYAQGVKANVIFFDNHEASPNHWTKQVWYYDYRTNIHHTLKKKPMRFEHLSDFIDCYNPRNRHQRAATWDPEKAPDGRWRSYSYEELTAREDQP